MEEMMEHEMVNHNNIVVEEMDHLSSKELMLKFGTVWNYLVLGGMLACSSLIGIYFWRQEQSSPEDTLLGGRNMHVLPVTFSLVASFLSAITLLGMPAEVYTQGTQFLTVLGFIPVTAVLVTQVYIPVFHRLQAPSSYYYLELRFNRTVRLLGASLSTTALLLYIGIVTYLPALALEQVTGIDINVACVTIFVVCVFYTTAGGFKAVIWTDVFQLFFMFLSTGYIIVVATQQAGGPAKVVDRNVEDSRLQLFNIAIDPRERHTLWGTMFGAGIMWMSVFGVSQTQVQRYLSLRTVGEAKKACLLTMITMASLIIMVGWLGMVLYTVYADCDPITAGQVKKKDQVLPLLVLHVAGDIPGLPGLFMAGVFSGSLSTISTGLNALAAIALRDFMPAKMRESMSDKRQAFLTKIFALFFGALTFGVTFVIRYLPGMLEAAIVIGGVVNGPIIGIFTAGMLLPWVDSRGALTGFLTSVVFTTWVATGGTIYKRYQPYVSITSPHLPNSTSGCPADWLEGLESEIVAPSPTQPTQPLAGHLDLYDISYVWYSCIGSSLVVIVALLSACFVSSQDLSQLDKGLLAPVVPHIIYWLPLKMRKGWKSCEHLKEADGKMNVTKL